MDTTLIEALEYAIKRLTEQASSNASPDQALKYSQAALNLAHVHVTLRPPGT